MQNIKEEYLEQYRQMHLSRNMFGGGSFAKSFWQIKYLIKITKSKTVLDYGCGKGKQYTNDTVQRLGIFPTLYDPAVSGYEILPDQHFDGIYSTDVMEHIPEEVLPETFEYIFSHAKKYVFMSISTSYANKKLPNGKNAHCTVKPIDWWINEIEKYATVYTHLQFNGNLSNGCREIILNENQLD